MFFPNIKRNDIWQTGYNTLAQIDVRDDNLHFHNIRNIDYSDKSENYYDDIFDIDKLTNMYLISVPFGFKGCLSHLMLEFEFIDRCVYLSVEARRQPGEWFSVFKWLFRHFGLIYVWGSYGDLVGLRKDVRQVSVYRHKLNIDKNEMKFGLKYFIGRTNKLIDNPEYYNSITKNCTTELFKALQNKKNIKIRSNYSVVLSWYIEKYLFSLWVIWDYSGDFNTYRQKVLLK